jgi:hypothetical protein
MVKYIPTDKSVSIEYLRAIYADLEEGGYHPRWFQHYTDQFWIEMRYDCDRRKPVATEYPNLEIAIDGDSILISVHGLDQIETVYHRIQWPLIDLKDPNSFGQIRTEVERFEKIVETSLEAGFAGTRIVDPAVIISAYGPRPNKLR